MGWIFSINSNQTKEEFINGILNGLNRSNSKVIDHSLKGNNLWIVRNFTDANDNNKSYNVICLYLIEKQDGCFGYKDLDEYCGLYEMNCPVSYFKLAPVIEKFDSAGYCAKWRQSVLDMNKQNAEKSKFLKTLKENDVITILNVKGTFAIAEMIGNNAIARCIETGVVYKITPKLLKNSTKVAVAV